MRQISYQLFSSRHFSPVTDTLRMLSEFGYSHVEGYGSQFRHGPYIAELQSALKAFGLRMPTVHFSLAKIQVVPDKIIAIAESFEIEGVVIPDVPMGLSLRTKDDWAGFGLEIAEAARPLRDAGLTVSYHNHDTELLELPDGSTPLAVLLDADPDLQIELDIAWAHKAFRDPVKEIETYGARIRGAHIKDVAALGKNLQEDGWADVGQGVLCWQKIWRALNAADVVNRVVEHNKPADHWRFAKRSIETLRELDHQYAS